MQNVSIVRKEREREKPFRFKKHRREKKNPSKKAFFKKAPKKVKIQNAEKTVSNMESENNSEKEGKNRKKKGPNAVSKKSGGKKKRKKSQREKNAGQNLNLN